MKYCPECGAKLENETKFCPECGAKLNSGERMSSAELIEKQINENSKTEKKGGKAGIIIAIIAVLVIGITAALFFSGVFGGKSFSDNTKAIQKASASVVRLDCFDKDGNLYCTGSAFAVFEDGVFATNYHVIEQEVYSILAYTEDNTMFEINSVLAYDAAKDMAIIKTDAVTNIAPLTLGNSDVLQKGEKVVAIGSPLGLLNTVSTGVFSAYNDIGSMKELQFSASISSGSSGGALFNDNGEVIGITYASYIDGQNLNVAVPANELKTLWDNRGEKLTVPEFYDTFDHIPTYTVDYVLANRNSLKENANVIGYVSDINDGCFYIVADSSLIEVCKYDKTNTNGGNNVLSYEEWKATRLDDNTSVLEEYAIEVVATGFPEKMIGVNVGDFVAINCYLRQINTWSKLATSDNQYKINLSSKSEITVIS